MRRAVILIILLSLICFGAGLRLDHLQLDTAQRYLDALHLLRRQAEAGMMDAAYQQQREIHALWQRDEHWMNCLISHHHTRAVSEAMLRMATALQMGWQVEALEAMDAAQSALEEIYDAHGVNLPNVW